MVPRRLPAVRPARPFHTGSEPPATRTSPRVKPRIKIVTIGVVAESAAPTYATARIVGPEQAAEIAREILPEDREGFAVLMLNARHQCVSVNLVTIGSLNATIVHPREVFKAAILSNASSIIVVHNHPSGDPEPSAEDLDMTERLKRCGDILGIALLDHVIVAPGGSHVSLTARGTK